MDMVDQQLLTLVRQLEQTVAADSVYGSVAEIPDDYPGLAAIRKITRKYNRQDGRLTGSRNERIKELFLAGESNGEIAKKLDISISVVKGVVRKLGPSGFEAVYDIYKGQTLLCSGTIAEVAEQLQVKNETVRFYINSRAKRFGNQTWGVRVGRRLKDD